MPGSLHANAARNRILPTIVEKLPDALASESGNKESFPLPAGQPCPLPHSKKQLSGIPADLKSPPQSYKTRRDKIRFQLIRITLFLRIRRARYTSFSSSRASAPTIAE